MMIQTALPVVGSCSRRRNSINAAATEKPEQKQNAHISNITVRSPILPNINTVKKIIAGIMATMNFANGKVRQVGLGLSLIYSAS